MGLQVVRLAGENNTADKAARLFNLNVGVLGHVDSGKTSLVAALSTHLSTAALDKHPQSKERGITLDLGFSSFTVDQLPPQIQQQGSFTGLQVTLVDCPGHASLIRTIIGGAQIIDMMLLVIDVTKGIQAQTAECIVLGEIATDRIIVILSKIDLLPEPGRPKLIAKAQKLVKATFQATRFAGCTILPASVKPGEGEEQARGQGMDAIVAEIMRLVPSKPWQPGGAFLFAVDHCFSIRGQGTVLTGTVLQGGAKVGEVIELPELRLQKKVKSMQMFRRPVQSCAQGDRVGICVTKLDATSIERGLACTPASIPTFSSAIAAVEKIRFHVGELKTRMKLHVTVGHSTVMATAMFFGLPDSPGAPSSLSAIAMRIGRLSVKDDVHSFDFAQEYLHQNYLYGLEGRPVASEQSRSPSHGQSSQTGSTARHYGPQWALLEFSQPITAPKDALVIGSRLDADAGFKTCRLALYGRIVSLIDSSVPADLAKLKIYKTKQKNGAIKRVDKDANGAVCQGLFKKETDLTPFVGMKVTAGCGTSGVITGSFGKSGKFRVSFADGLPQQLGDGDKALALVFKRFVFDRDKRHMAQ